MRSPRVLRGLGASVLVVALSLNLLAAVLRATLSGVAILDAIAAFPLPILGALLVWKQPSHPIGWLMLLLGTAAGITGVSSAVLEDRGLSDPSAGVAQLFNHLGFAVLVGLFGLLLVLFPTGEVASRRWRIFRWLPIVAIIFISASGVFGTPDDALEARSPLAVEGAGSLFELLGGIGLVSGFISIVGGGASVIVRARSDDVTVRAQIKWFALAVATLVALLVVGVTPLFRGPQATRVFDVVLVLIVGVVMPSCIAVAVLKHRLYDVDLVVNRALVYGALTAILGGAYLGLVVLLQGALRPIASDSDLAVAGSTLAVAALFQPARARTQSFIDRRFYRGKYDAAAALESFSSRLRDEVDLGSLSHELVTVVGTTMQPAHASLWLRDGVRTLRMTPRSSSTTLPLKGGGRVVQPV